YLTLAPEYGDAALLRTFVDVLHAAGIRIIWDFVPNHSGLGFAPFQHAVTYGDTSSYWDWYNFHPVDGLQAGDGRDYDAWFGFGSLPKLETSNPEVFDYLIGVATHWTRYGFDGIRVDVPNELENRTTFFQAFRAETKSINPDVYLIGEIWHRDPSWVQGDQFDALMNYALGQEAAMKFARAEIGGSAAWHAMAQLYASYPEASTAMAFNIAASHDTDRLLTMVGGGELGSTPDATALARQRLASAILYAIPGMPVTYYGDECAMLGSNAGSIHRARRTMQWDSCDPAMLTHYTQLAGLKHGLDALGSPVIREYQATGPLLSFLRGEPGAGEVLGAFNQSSSEQTVTLPAGSWTDAVAGGTFTGTATLPAYGWRYLVRQ
ncbi:MAG TPA: alpha-amylase family glycosyl hydrolase, partial [Longimicrobiales bacterium]|nr:alpha-amylase family glycosyl hydrolase [Longimicrobiales bacterium]